MTKHLIYFSASAPTSGNFDTTKLIQAGRLDIAIHSIIQGLFLSHGIREDVVFHLIFYGMPDPPKHIMIQVNEKTPISKKDVGSMLRKTLYKSNNMKAGAKLEVFPGVVVEKKSFLKVIDDLENEGVEIFILDKKGEDIRKVDIPNDCGFVLGDHNGLPSKELKRLKKSATLVSVGDKMYFASQTVAVVNNELDYRRI